MTVSDLVIEPQVHTHGDVTPEAEDYAREKVISALHHAPAPLLRIRLNLDAAAPGPRIDVHADVNGVGIHVHAVGETMQEATDLLQERLRSRLRHMRRRPAQGLRSRAS
ncbi:HPF/RaiA family ribosome-associated protein [Actinoplanes sp. NPDC024001]|uniref:HPF/RaiA family ribosome-associated protein n=1 Tax=unclassified Actinoplanes TaxID=2626549 RepID=UPI002E207B9B